MSANHDSAASKTPPSNQEISPTPSPSKVRPLNPNALAHTPAVVAPAQSDAGARREWAPNHRWGDAPHDPSANPESSASGWEVTGSSGAVPIQTPTEAEYYHTRNAISHLPRTALVQVLHSLIDEIPQLVPAVRFRCDRVAVTAGPQGGQFAGGPWHDTPTGRRKSATRREDEYETCAIHGIVRSTKHLQFMANGQRWECVPGFHCLESSPGTSPVKSSKNSQSPAKTSPPLAPTLESKPSAGLLRTSPSPQPPSADDPEVARIESLLSTLRS